MNCFSTNLRYVTNNLIPSVKNISFIVLLIFLIGPLHIVAKDSEEFPQDLLRYNVIMVGEILRLSSQAEIIGREQIVNIKTKLPKNFKFKDNLLFNFVGSEKSSLKIKITHKDEKNYYKLDDKFTFCDRSYLPFLMLFEVGKYNWFTFSFLMSELKDPNLFLKTKGYIVEDKKVNLDWLLSDYSSLQEQKIVADDIKRIKYKLDGKSLKVCVHFDASAFHETIRISKLKQGEKLLSQNILVKDHDKIGCLIQKIKLDEYDHLSFLYWKADWNRGYFREYNFTLK